MALPGMSWRRNMQFGSVQVLLLSSCLFFAPASSRLRVNVTVDDTFGDPVSGSFPEYLPNNGTWNSGSSAGSCPSCYIGPSILDLTQIHNETWHDTTYLPWETPATITVHFNGSAVYVFNILPNMLPNTITLANISFSMDGKDVGTFIHSPESGTTTILYNQLVYHNTTLNDGPHTLTMAAGSNSLVLFDYLIYTTQSNDTTPSASATSTNTAQSSASSTPVSAVVGVVGGVVLLLGVTAIGVFLLYRRHRHHGNDNDNDGGCSKRHRHLVRGDSTPSSCSQPEPILRSFDGPTAYSIPHLAPSNVSGPDTCPTPFMVDAPSPSSSSGAWSLKRRAELTWRLEVLQRTRSVLSSQAPSDRLRLEVSSEGGTETAAIRELEAEMAQFRDLLSALNARLADDDREVGHLEPLPGHVE